MADRIAVMDKGRIVQCGTPVEVYERPNCRWIAGFVGDVNLIEAAVTAVYPKAVHLERPGLRLRAAHEAGVVAPGMPAAVAVRPEKIRITHEVPEGQVENGAAGTVTDIGYLGTMSIYKVRIADDLSLKVAVMNEQRGARPIHVNDRVWLSWTPDAGVLLVN